MVKYNLLNILLISLLMVQCQTEVNSETEEPNQSEDWNLVFEDDCTKDWQTNWFLDGLLAKVENNEEGMTFSAGPEAFNDTNHAVLWTKKSFAGDIKIEYEFTRRDTAHRMVNILYVQATGVSPYSTNIYEWRKERETPSMRTYFNNMKTLHISYAAFNNKDLTKPDYVRARIYPVNAERTFKQMAIEPSYYDTKLFLPNVTYKITMIKTNTDFVFQVEGADVSKEFAWKLTEKQTVTEGRIGLRHMYTRSSQYKNFKVYTK
ncbi:MAG: DUF1961 family protein [Flavobacteriales bacterium]|nr:DUF1961 family protein [Flavobacteriales bacterium]